MKPGSNNRCLTASVTAPLVVLAVLWVSPAGVVGEDPPQPPPGTALNENGIPVGWVLIEGDIQVPADWLTNRGTYTTTLWGGQPAEIPVEFDDNVNSSEEQQAWNAMQIWEDVANVDFRARVWSDTSWVHFRDSSGDPEPANNSPVGWGLGQRTINIVDWPSVYIIAHEVGHTLGYWHEQSRPDRDNYVEIEWENIPEEDEPNFELHAEAGDYGWYDFDSVMHYSQCAFSDCSNCMGDLENCRTITVLPPNESWQFQIGQCTHLSYLDATTMSFLYAEDSWWFLDCDYTGQSEGTFLQPCKTLQQVYLLMDPGETVWIQPGHYSAVGTWGVTSNSEIWRAPLGGVVLGN